MNGAMQHTDRQKLLGDFVRAHRERISPGEAAGRRRTPGLRREELAARAGISATWCAWIEQGRDVRVSPEALGRLAKAMSLSRAERAYLFELAGRSDPDIAQLAADVDAPTSVRVLVDALKAPAYGLDPLYNACCWNPAAAKLFEGWLGDRCERNLLRYVFLDPSARALIPQWETRARRVLGEFRSGYGRGHTDPRIRTLVDDLRASSRLFARAWDDQAVLEHEGGLRTFCHPRNGDLSFIQHAFSPTDRPDYRVILLTPVKSQTVARHVRRRS